MQGRATYTVPITRRFSLKPPVGSNRTQLMLSRLQAYAYCGCYFVEPDQIFNCANVELQINGGSGKMFGPAPSSTILSSALLNGPIAPSSATLSNIPTSVPTNVPLFSPRQSSSLVAASTAFITSTTVVTSCTSDGVTNCPATTIVSSAAVVSSTWTCGPEGCIIPPSSLPPIIKIATDTPLSMECPPGSCDIPSYISIPTDYMAPDETPLPTAAITSSSPGDGIPASAGTLATAIPTTPPVVVASPSSNSQSTTTSLSTVAITRTSTITICPSTVTACPLGAYSSEVTYTTSTVNTILSCNGGCEGMGPSKMGECVVREKVKVLTRREL
ncbi:MAG: hypothetical protein Q9171_000682 [Xanthocarpia ochracea]